MATRNFVKTQSERFGIDPNTIPQSVDFQSYFLGREHGQTWELSFKVDGSERNFFVVSKNVIESTNINEIYASIYNNDEPQIKFRSRSVDGNVKYEGKSVSLYQKLKDSGAVPDQIINRLKPVLQKINSSICFFDKIIAEGITQQITYEISLGNRLTNIIMNYLYLNAPNLEMTIVRGIEDALENPIDFITSVREDIPEDERLQMTLENANTFLYGGESGLENVTVDLYDGLFSSMTRWADVLSFASLNRRVRNYFEARKEIIAKNLVMNKYKHIYDEIDYDQIRSWSSFVLGLDYTYYEYSRQLRSTFPTLRRIGKFYAITPTDITGQELVMDKYYKELPL